MEHPDSKALAALLLEALREVLSKDLGRDERRVDENSPLMGAEAVIDSYARILFLVKAEDCCREHGIPFSMQIDVDADSGEHPFRTVGALADYLAERAFRGVEQ